MRTILLSFFLIFIVGVGLLVSVREGFFADIPPFIGAAFSAKAFNSTKTYSAGEMVIFNKNFYITTKGAKPSILTPDNDLNTWNIFPMNTFPPQYTALLQNVLDSSTPPSPSPSPSCAASTVSNSAQINVLQRAVDGTWVDQNKQAWKPDRPKNGWQPDSVWPEDSSESDCKRNRSDSESPDMSKYIKKDEIPCWNCSL